MNEMIEKAAEALWGEWSLWAPPISQPKPAWADLAEGNKDIARRMVRAVLRSIREPSDEVIMAGSLTGLGYDVVGDWHADAGGVIWGVMVGRLLE